MNSTFDVTTIIQGPPNERSLNHIPTYQKYGPVVVSCWDDDVPNVTGVTLTANPKPVPVYYVNSANKTFSYQIHSILNGLRVVETKYVIRTRSDEFYNLDNLIAKYNQRDEIVLCGNIFFKPWTYYKYHMGDHLFIGRTDVLLKAYSALADDVGRYGIMACAEQSSTFAILDAFGDEWTREGFLRHFDVIDINQLKPFTARWNSIGHDYDNLFDHPDVITDISQI